MPSHIDTAVHTKAFDYPVAGHWGETEMFPPVLRDWVIKGLWLGSFRVVTDIHTHDRQKAMATGQLYCIKLR